MSFCPACGASVEGDAKFCVSCGQSLRDEVPAPPTPRAKPPLLARVARTLWPKSGVSMRRELFLVVIYAVVLIVVFTRLLTR